jgi:hypothetical protein
MKLHTLLAKILLCTSIRFVACKSLNSDISINLNSPDCIYRSSAFFTNLEKLTKSDEVTNLEKSTKSDEVTNLEKSTKSDEDLANHISVFYKRYEDELFLYKEFNSNMFAFKAKVFMLVCTKDIIVLYLLKLINPPLRIKQYCYLTVVIDAYLSYPLATMKSKIGSKYIYW